MYTKVSSRLKEACSEDLSSFLFALQGLAYISILELWPLKIESKKQERGMGRGRHRSLASSKEFLQMPHSVTSCRSHWPFLVSLENGKNWHLRVLINQGSVLKGEAKIDMGSVISCFCHSDSKR